MMVNSFISFRIPNINVFSYLAYLGDTFHHSHSTMPALESFNPLKPMVFAGIYPLESGRFLKLEEAVKKLTLTDRSVTSLRESSSFLGQGFRLGL